VGYNLGVHYIKPYLLALGADHPFIGHAHDTLIQFLSNTGALGLAAYLVFSIMMFVMTWRGWQEARGCNRERAVLFLASLGAQVNLHLGGFGECNFFDGEVNHMFTFIMAFTVSLILLNQKRYAGFLDVWNRRDRTA